MVQFFTFVRNFFEDKPSELRLECLTGAYTPSVVSLRPESTYVLNTHGGTLTGVADNEQDVSNLLDRLGHRSLDAVLSDDRVTVQVTNLRLVTP